MYVNKILQRIALTGLFLTPLIPLVIADGHLFPSLLFPFITGKNFFFRIIVEIIFSVWLILAIRDKNYAPKTSFILWSLVSFLGVIFLSDFFSLNPEKSFWSNFERMEGFVTLIHLFGFFLVAGSLLSTQKMWNWFFHTNVGVSIFITFYSVLQLVGDLVINQGGVRVDGTLGNAIYLAVYLLFIIFFLIYFCCTNQTKIKEILWSLVGGAGGFVIFYLAHIFPEDVDHTSRGLLVFFIALILAGLALFVLYVKKEDKLPSWSRVLVYGVVILSEFYILFETATRGAILGLALGIIFISITLSLYEKKNIILKNLSISFLVVLFLVGALFFGLKDKKFVTDNLTLARFSFLFSTSELRSFFTDGQGKARVLNAQMALQGLKDRPILGWGQESFNYVFYKYYNPEMYDQETWFDRAHNVVFDWLVAGGILGLLGYLSIFFFSLYYLWKKQQGKEHQMSFIERVVITGLLIAYFLENLTVFDNITSYFLFFTVLAYIHSFYGKKMSVGKNKSDSSNTLSGDATVWVAVPLLLFFCIYFVNVKPMLASKDLISAMSPQKEGLEKNLTYFKKALSYNSFADSEIREYLEDVALKVSQENVDQELKREYLIFTKDQLDQQLKETPQDVRYYYLAGTFLNEAQHPLEAIPYIEKAISLSPKKQNLLFELGIEYLNIGEYESAQEVFKRNYELEPKYDQARIFYALSLVYMKNLTLAEEILGENYKEIFLADEYFINAFVNSGQASKIVAIGKELITKYPNDLGPRLSLVKVYMKMKDTVSAVGQLERTIKLYPEFKEQGEELIKKIQEGK